MIRLVKTSLFSILFLFASPLLAQRVVTQITQPPLSVARIASPCYSLAGSGVSENKLTWWVSGTITGNIKLVSSPNSDCSSPSDLIAGVAISSGGVSAITDGVFNYVRIVLVGAGGSGSVIAQYDGYTDKIASGGGGISGSGSSGQIPVFSGSTVIGGSDNFKFSSANQLLSLIGNQITAPQGITVATGTTTANMAVTIIGSGTKFLTEVHVGDSISLSSASAVFGIVQAVMTDTSLLLDNDYDTEALGDGTVQTINIRHSQWGLQDVNGVTIGVAAQPNYSVTGSTSTLAFGDPVQGSSGNVFPLFDAGAAFNYFLAGPRDTGIQVYAAVNGALTNRFPAAIDVGAFENADPMLDSGFAAAVYVLSAHSFNYNATLPRYGHNAIIQNSSGNTSSKLFSYGGSLIYNSGTITDGGIYVAEDNTDVSGVTLFSGFKSNVVAGSGKYAFNAAGTAASYFGGSVQFNSGGAATKIACFGSDGKTLGYATMVAGNITTCNTP